jgi:hypothetical protein
MFHIKAGGSVNLSLNSFGGIGARYAFYVDNGAIMSESNIDAGWDTVGTIVDTSAGGVWSTGIRISGASATCSMIGATWSSPQTGNFPCFNMGPNGELALTNFQNQGSKGSFIVTSGSSITLQNSGNRGLGGALDGGDYHQIQVTGGSSGMLVQNSYFSGNANTTNNQQHHVHGIVTTGHTPNYLVLQGNTFVYHEDDITTSFASSVTSISGNTTISTAGASSFSIVGAGFGIGMNTWDRLPQATILSGFGTGPAIQTNTGDYRNFRLVIGTGGTSGNGSVKMPVESPGGYMCLATVNDINSFYTASVASNSTDVAFFNYNRSTGGGAPWNAGNVVTVQCQGL